MKAARFVYAVVEVSYLIFPSAIAGLLFLSPCQPPFIGSHLFPKCLCPTILARISAAIFELTAVSYMAVIGSTYVEHVLFTGIVHLWTRSKSDAVFNRNSISNYRELQIFEKLLNSCVLSRIFPSMAWLGPIVQIMGTFALIKFHGGMNPFHVAFVVTETVIMAGCNLILFSGAGRIYGKSCEWLVLVKNGKIGDIQNNVGRKVLKSMPPLRVWFSGNFVDRLTPLVIQQFCMLQTMNLLLLA